MPLTYSDGADIKAARSLIECGVLDQESRHETLLDAIRTSVGSAVQNLGGVESIDLGCYYVSIWWRGNEWEAGMGYVSLMNTLPLCGVLGVLFDAGGNKLCKEFIETLAPHFAPPEHWKDLLSYLDWYGDLTGEEDEDGNPVRGDVMTTEKGLEWMGDLPPYVFGAKDTLPLKFEHKPSKAADRIIQLAAALKKPECWEGPLGYTTWNDQCPVRDSLDVVDRAIGEGALGPPDDEGLSTHGTFPEVLDDVRKVRDWFAAGEELMQYARDLL